MLNSLRKRLNEEKEQGFTLIELLIVIVVLGILAGIVVFAVGNATGDSNVAACKSDRKNVEVAAEAYKASPSGGKGKYPADDTAAKGALVPNYLKTWPKSDAYVIAWSGTATTVTAAGASALSDADLAKCTTTG